MSRDKSDRSNAIPSWQSRKMKKLIAERWQEVWSIVKARNKNQNYG